MKFLTDYKIILRPDDNGTFVAYIPAIEGCQAWGKTPEEARSELNYVFEMIREEYLDCVTIRGSSFLIFNDGEVLILREEQ